MGLGMPTYRPSYSGGNWGGKFGGPSATQAAKMAPGVGAVGIAGLAQGYQADGPKAPTASDLLNQFQNAQAYYQSFYAPDMTGLQNQFSDLLNRRNATQSNYQQTVDLTRQRYDLLQQELAAQGQINQIDMGGANRRMQLMDQLANLLGHRRDADIGMTSTMQNIANQMFDINKKQLGIKETGTKRGTERARAKALSDAIARGAVVTPGHEGDMGFIAAEGQDALSQIGLERDAATTDFAKTREQLNHQTKNIMTDYQTQFLNNQEQKAQARDRMKQLEIQAKNYGIEKNKLANELQSTLARLQLDRTMSVGQLMDMMSSNNAQQRAIAQQIMNAAKQNQSQFSVTGGANLSWGPSSVPGGDTHRQAGGNVYRR